MIKYEFYASSEEMTYLYNQKHLLERRKFLRKNIPVTEQLLWQHLRARRLDGFKFRRQYGIGRYVVDFYCPELRIAIEIDGDSHFYPRAQAYDAFRQKRIETYMIRFLRFTNDDVMENIDGVLECIRRETQKGKPPPAPPYKGGEIKKHPR